MKGFNKLIAIIIALLLLALIVLAVISTTGLKSFLNLDLSYTYINSLPSWISWGNLIIVYGIVLLKLIVIFALLKGSKKSARVVILPLLIIAADLMYRNIDIFKDFYSSIFASFVLSDMFNALLNYGLINLLTFGAYAAILLFMLFYVIVAVIGKTHKLGVRIVLFLLALLPIGLIYGTYIRQSIYLPAYSEIAHYGIEFGIYFLVGFVVSITHFDKDKYQRRSERIKEHAYPTLPLDKLAK